MKEWHAIAQLGVLRAPLIHLASRPRVSPPLGAAASPGGRCPACSLAWLNHGFEVRWSPFSDPGATATPWAQARGVLDKAGVFWLSTVRPDGRPHVTPLVAVWVDGSLYFCTGPDEVKAKNLARNARCILTTGCNAFRKGLDVVVEGEVGVVTDEALLRRLVAIWKRKTASDS
jgi:general stress protein 26